MQLRPNYLDAHFKLGNTLATNGSPEEAAKSFRRVLQLNPNYVDALNNLANTLLGSGKPAEAVALYRRVLTTQPEHFWPATIWRRGCWPWGRLKRQPTPPAARSPCGRITRRRRNLGDALAAGGKWADAAESYNKLIELESGRSGDPAPPPMRG